LRPKKRHTTGREREREREQEEKKMELQIIDLVSVGTGGLTVAVGHE